jgi:hypothetical protein
MRQIEDNYKNNTIQTQITNNNLQSEPWCSNINHGTNHQSIQIKNISSFTSMLKNLIVDQQKKVLLVCDIDDTLIRPIVDIGSEAWFSYSIKHEHIDDVIDKLAIVYGILKFQSVEKDTDDLITLIKELSDPIGSDPNDNPQLKYLCLTSRNVRFHSHTLMHMHQTNYDKIFVRRNMLEIDDSMYILEHSSNPYGKPSIPLIRYADNICFTSGNDKGIAMDQILTKYFKNNEADKLFDVVVFIDDSKYNIDCVHDSLMNISKKYPINSICAHYTFMQEHKNNYSINHFIDDSNKINKLNEIKDQINTKKILEPLFLKIIKYMFKILSSFFCLLFVYYFHQSTDRYSIPVKIE